MAQDLSIARSFLAHCQSGTAAELLTDPTLCIARSGALRVAYAPFDYIETRARLVVVGITPGLTQAVNALTAAQAALCRGLPIEAALADAKLTGSFSGAIRSNLVAMLDAIGVARHLEVETTATLFAPGSTEVHFTSALRYPVFVGARNYNGTPERNYNGTPDMLTTPLLRQIVETHLAEEARALPDALWLPLGPKADAAVRHLVRIGLLEGDRVLSGLPHPSGANAERVAVFLGRKAPERASRQTNPAQLLSAFARLKAQIANLEGETA